ncbi:MAG: hypothetical protein QM758_10895 [Armatimonas sp.]
MKKWLLITLLITGFGATISTARAQERPMETYRARLSARDHVSSRGERLKKPAAIIRQDRANFHKFGKRDSEDGYDSFFSKSSNRDRLEKLLERGTISRSARNLIVNGNPLIEVQIYKNRVSVSVATGGVWD